MENQIISDPKKQFWVVASLIFASLMYALDIYIVNISLPTIAGYFGVGTEMVSWVTLSYLMAVASTLLLCGKLGDRFGIKNIFIQGYCVFTAGSLMCGLSPNLFFLVASRFVQGVGASMFTATVFAAVTRYLPVDKRGWVFGLVSMAAAFGITIGAPLGGLISAYSTWHWIFLINIPFGIVAVIIAKANLPAPRRISERKKVSGFDITGAALSFFSILALVYALNKSDHYGWFSPVILSTMAFFAVTMAAFIVREARLKDPMLDLDLFRNPGFSLANLSAAAGYMYLSGNNFLFPFYLVLVKNLRSSQAGFLIMIYSLVYMAFSSFTGKMSDRIKGGYLCAFGMLLAAAASLIFVLALNVPGMIFVVAYLALLGAAYGFFIAPNNNQLMSFATANKYGTASGVFMAVKTLSLVIGVNIFEAIFSGTSAHKFTSLAGGRVQADMPVDSFLKGFRRAYILGIVVCLAAAVFSYMAGRTRQADRDRETPGRLWK
ncbi:MAG: MFS transporter [Candidatus Omnitrophota bacterium]